MSHALDNLRHHFGDDGASVFRNPAHRVNRAARVVTAILIENKLAWEYLSPGEVETMLDGAPHALDTAEKKLLRGVKSFSELKQVIPMLETSLGPKLLAFADYHTVITAEGEKPRTIDWQVELPDEELSIIATMYQMGRWPSLSRKDYDFDSLRENIIQNAAIWCSAQAARKDWNKALLPLGLQALLAIPKATNGRRLRASFAESYRLSIPYQQSEESLQAYVRKLPQIQFITRRHSSMLKKFPDQSLALSTALDGYAKGWERFTPLRLKKDKLMNASIVKAIDESIWGELKRHERKQLGIYVSEDCWVLAESLRTAAAKKMQEGLSWEESVNIAIRELPDSKKKQGNFEAACRLAIKNAEVLSPTAYDITPHSELNAIKGGNVETTRATEINLESTTETPDFILDPFTVALAASRLHREIENMLEVISDGPVMGLNALRTQLAKPQPPISSEAVKALESFLEQNAHPKMLQVFRAVQRSFKAAPVSLDIPPVAELLARPTARRAAAAQIASHLLEHAERIAPYLEQSHSLI